MTDIAVLEFELLAQIEGADTQAALEEVRIKALGKKGIVSERMKALGR